MATQIINAPKGNFNEIEMLNYIDDVISSNDIENALKLLNHFTFEDKFSNYKNYLLGLCFLKCNNPDYEKAFNYFSTINNDNDLISILKLNCRYNLEDYEEIIKFHIGNSKTTLLKNEEYLLIVALTYEKLKLSKYAVKIYKEILDINKNNKIAINNLLVLCIKSKPSDLMKNSTDGSINKTIVDDILNKFLNERKNNSYNPNYNNNISNQLNFSQSPELMNNLALLLLSNNNINEGLSLFEEILTGKIEFTITEELRCNIVNNYINQLINANEIAKAEEILEDNYLEDKTGIQVLMYANIKLQNNDLIESRKLYGTYIEKNDLLNILNNIDNYDYNEIIQKEEQSYLKNYNVILGNYTALEGLISAINNNLNNSNDKNLNSNLNTSNNNATKPEVYRNKSLNNAHQGLGIDTNNNNFNNFEHATQKDSRNRIIQKSGKNLSYVQSEDNVIKSRDYNYEEMNHKDYNVRNNQESESKFKNSQSYENQNASNANVLTIRDKKLINEEIAELENQESNQNSNNNLIISIKNSNNTNKYSKINDNSSKTTSNKDNNLIENKKINDYVNSVFDNAYSKFKKEENSDEHEEELFESFKEIFEAEKSESNPKFNKTKNEIIKLQPKIKKEKLIIQFHTIISYIAFFEKDYYTIIQKLSAYQDKLNSNQLFMLEKAYKETNEVDSLIRLYEILYSNTSDNKYLWEIIELCNRSSDSEKFKSTATIIIEEEINLNENNNDYEYVPSYPNLEALLELVLIKQINNDAVTKPIIDYLLEIYKTRAVDNNKLLEPNYFYYLGLYNMKKKNHNSAYEYFIKLEENSQYSKNPEFLKSFAKLCVKLKNSKKALKLFKNAFKLNNSDFDACLGIGECYLNLDDIKGSSKYLDYCISMEGSSENKANTYFALGRLMHKKKDFLHAVEYFLKCTSYDPNSYRSYHNAALIYLSMNDINKAKEYLEKCIEINSSYYVAYYELYTLYVKEDQIKEESKNSSEVINNKAYKDGLKEKFEKIIDYLPSSYPEFCKLLLDYFDDPEKCVKYLNKYLKSKEVNASKAFELLDGLIKKSQFNHAYNIFLELLNHGGKDYKLYSKVCSFYIKANSIDYALKVIKPCVKSNPDNFNVISKYAFCLLKIRDFENALKKYQISEELFSNDLKYNGFLKQISYCYCELNQFENALNEMKKHHTKLSEENNNLALAKISLCLNKEKEAKNYLTIEKKMFPDNLTKDLEISDLKNMSFSDIYKF